MAVRKGRTSRRKPRARWSARRLALAPFEGGTLADRAADTLRRLILRGTITPGQRLQPMRELAKQMGVSLPVVREAVAQLKGEGLLQVRHGNGTFASRRPTTARSLRAARRRASRQEAAELRISVDPAVARAAAARATSDNLIELHFALGERRLAMLGKDPATLTQADIAFHLAVAKAAGNGLGVGIHRLGARLLRPDLAARAVDFVHNGELAALHDALFEAIELERPGRAERAARAIAAIEARPP